MNFQLRVKVSLSSQDTTANLRFDQLTSPRTSDIPSSRNRGILLSRGLPGTMKLQASQGSCPFTARSTVMINISQQPVEIPPRLSLIRWKSPFRPCLSTTMAHLYALSESCVHASQSGWFHGMRIAIPVRSRNGHAYQNVTKIRDSHLQSRASPFKALEEAPQCLGNPQAGYLSGVEELICMRQTQMFV